MIGEEFQGNGYGKEALEKGLAISFLEYNCHKVNLYVYSFNEKAINLYKKLGFKHEGTRREAMYMNGKWYDVIDMGILRKEYLENNNL